MRWCVILLVLATLDRSLVNAQSKGSACSLRNQRGTCQLLTKCGPALDDLKAGKRPEVVCGFDKLIPIVCCLNSDGTTTSPITPKPSIRRAQQKCQEYATTSMHSPIDSVIVSESDYPEPPAIIGGNTARPKELLHMAAIGYSTNSSSIAWNCGGGLISHSWVLTAAHCTYSFLWGYAKYVRVGDLDLNSDMDDARPQDRYVIERVKHPDYKKPAQYNDIALLKMDRPVTFDAYVRPACLSLNPNIQTGEKTVVAGWGITDWSNDKGSSSLMLVNVPIVDYDTCKKFFANEGNKLPLGLNAESQLCAGEDGKDTCQGDSGGPLMVRSESQSDMYDIVGVTSFGKFCGSVIPGVYTKVYHYLDWIEDTVWP